MYYSPWVFVNLGAIFEIFETCPKRSLGSPEQLCVVSSEGHVSFELGSNLENITKNQLNPCTIVHGFLSIWVRFSEFSKLFQNDSLGSPKQLCVFSSEAHVSFELGSGFKNFA